MSKQIEASSGQGWARAAVAVGAVLSVAGNATETVLTESPVNLAIRITIAVALPVLVFIAVEVFVRVAWRRTALDFVGRVMLLTLPAFGAAYVSFGHLYSLSTRSGADWIAASANALAIDGLMIGGTVALLAIRAARLAEAQTPPRTLETPAGNVITFDRDLPEAEVAEFKESFQKAQREERAAFYTPPAVIEQEQTRKPRAAKADQAKAIALLLEGKPDEAVAAGLMSRATIATYAKVARLLQQDPSAEIGQKVNGRSVNAELVELIRTDARTAAQS